MTQGPSGNRAAGVRLRVEPRGAARLKAAAKLDGFVEIARGGVRPSHEDAVLLPPGTVHGFTVDRWRASVGGELRTQVCPTAHLTDGRMVRMTGLVRPPGDRACRVMWRVDGTRRWQPLTDDAGEPLAWTDDAGPALAAALARLVLERCGPETASAREAATIKLRGLQGRDPAPPPRGVVGAIKALRPNVSGHREWTRVRD